jgi:uncharacterized lipoprotein NlpE involved in copper resistance
MNRKESSFRPAKTLKWFFQSFSVLLVLISCSGLESDQKQASNSPNPPAKTGFKEIPSWTGTFQDTLPCVDCPGQLTWLTIEKSGVYSKSTTKLGYDDVFSNTSSSKGKWTFNPEKQIIALDSAVEKIWIGFQPSGDSILVLCDRNGSPIANGRWFLHRRGGGDSLGNP